MECLSKLLTSIFNKKLCSLERNSSLHFKCIQSTMVDTKYITTQCIMLSKRILKTNSNSGSSSGNGSNNTQKSINTKRDTSRSKTPKKTTSTTNVCNSAYKGKYNKTMYKSKSNGSLLQTKSVPRSIKQIYKNKSCANLIKDNNNREIVTSPNHNSKTDRTRTPKIQVTTKKRRQTRNFTMIEGNNSIKNKTIHESGNVYRKYKQSNKELIRRKHNSLNLVISDQLLGNNINININKQQQHNHHHQHVMRNIEDENMSHILTMETNIQSDFILNKEDSLLVTPITDIDFLNDNNNDNNIFTETPTTESNLIYTLLSLSNFKHIAPYLTTYDLTLLTLINKTTSLSVFTYIKHSLQTDIAFIESKLSSYTPSNKYQGIPKVQLSKGTTKAAELLNGPILNKIFKNKHKIPSCDVLRIYKIFFMLFDNGSDVVKAVHDKELFWERTCNYFMNGNENAKTGSVVLNMLNNEVVISYKMIYKVIKVLKGNVMKISPGFFSKKCGTTGLFTFFVKDVLDSYGLLIEEGKMNNEMYWTYVKVKDILKGYLTHIEMIFSKLES